MRGLLGDRFLRRFAGDLKHRRKHPASPGEGRNPEAEVDVAPRSKAPGVEAIWPEVVRSDNHVSEEDLGESVVHGATANTNDVPNDAEPNK